MSGISPRFQRCTLCGYEVPEACLRLLMYALGRFEVAEMCPRCLQRAKCVPKVCSWRLRYPRGSRGGKCMFEVAEICLRFF
jgi:hypothetical protein